MNDRYLYRAKRTDNGEWVEGYLVYDNFDHEYRIVIELDYSTGTCFHTMMAPRVDVSSICQCTELKDKNGNLIWENDICRRILVPTKRIEKNFRIAYVPYKCCLSAIDLDGSNITFLSDYINNQYEVEVIGNIFDNPELLEK